MKKITYLLAIIIMSTVSTSCSSVKVLDTWSSDNVKSVRSKNILVIARTSHKPSRIAFEEAMVKEIEKKGLKGVESFKKFPEIDPDSKLTLDEKNAIKEMLKKEGFNAIVVSVLKDVKKISKTETEGGYIAGESLASYYGIPPGGFYGFYTHPNAYSTYQGVDVAMTVTTQTAKIYVLQTLVHNLDLVEKEQLVALVTSEIVQPESIPDNAHQYAKAVMKAIQNN